jgi:hypothetical protein
MIELYLFATLQVRVLSLGFSIKIGKTVTTIYENGSNGGVTYSGEKVKDRG